MNKKSLIIAALATTAFFGCSSEEQNPINVPDNGTGELTPTDPSDPNSQIPSDPNNPGQQGSADPGQQGSADPNQQVQDPNNPGNQNNPGQQQNPGQVDPGVVPTSSASNGQIVASSSEGLKDYDDNHLPKESYLPAAGFYSNLTIQPLSGKQGGQVKCTFDGSFPTQNSESITAAKQITQNTVVRCSEFVNGQPVDTTTQTYFINENVSMPVVALTVNHHDMFDSTDGLYATGLMNNLHCTNPKFNTMAFGVNTSDNNNPKCTEPCYKANFWCEDEIPVHVEFFENGSATKEKNWEIDAGISIIGNYSRYKPKKSVAIKMDNDIYGDKTLKYSLFKTRPEAKKFKAFNLRNNGNRFWTDYYGDAMVTSLMEGTEVDYQRSRQVVVFYNGEYFGIHDMRERLNRGFAETNYGIDNKSINVVKNCSNGDAGYQDGWCPSGTNGASASEFAQLVNSIKNGNFEGENNQNYQQVAQKLNMVSFAQYMLAEMYAHNGDWPGNNVRFWGSPASGQPFKAMIFDTDHGYGFTPGISGFDTQSQNMFQWTLGSATESNNNNGGNQGGNQGGFGGMGGWDMGGMIGGMMGGASSPIGQMLKKLLVNPEFKRLFINQASILLNNYLTYEKVQAAVQSMNATIPSAELQRDVQRWPRNMSSFNWAPDGSDLLKFGQNRTETFKQEVKNYFGLQNEVSVTIAATGSGSVQVDGMKLPSTNYQGKFFEGNSMKLTAVSNAGAMFTGWSDGSTENPRVVQITNGASFTANFH